MTGKKKYLLLLCIAQISGILVWLFIIRFFTPQVSSYYLFFYTPFLLASFMSFVVSIFSPVRINFIESVVCFIPSVFVYILIYVLIPLADIILDNFPEQFGFFIYNLFTFDLPLIILGFALIYLAIWLGSLIKTIITKWKGELDPK